jgi:two-component system, NtrC family, sensor histidine kinase HydH
VILHRFSAGEWVSLAACAGILTLAILAFARGSKSPLGLPLGLLCLDMFVWNFSALAYTASAAPAWRSLDATFSSLTPPFALHFVLVFVGRRRTLSWLLVLSYVAYGVLSLSSAVGVVSGAARLWVNSSGWSLAYLGGWAPLIAVEVALLWRHLRACRSLEEQMRTRVVLASVAVGALLGSMALVDQLLFERHVLEPILAALPALRHTACLASLGLIAAVALRFRLFGRELEASVALYSLAVAAAGVIGYAAIFVWVESNLALLTVGVASVTLGVFAALRGVVAGIATRRARTRELATLGRFSAQMAHDLKNPLAALKGAVDFLVEERVQGRSVDGRERMLGLMKEQVRRLSAIIEKYRRMSEVRAVLAPVRVNEVVERAVGAAHLAPVEGAGRVEIRSELAPDLPECRADADLLASALENLVRNSLESMPGGGLLTLRTEPVHAGANGSIRITVEDQGGGMDARTVEHAFDDFYTTKAGGCGLGLAFVRRVAEVHGGEARLRSVLSRGTTVELLLPVAGPEVALERAPERPPGAP